MGGFIHCLSHNIIYHDKCLAKNHWSVRVAYGKFITETSGIVSHFRYDCMLGLVKKIVLGWISSEMSKKVG